jgi:hypothetical protein
MKSTLSLLLILTLTAPSSWGAEPQQAESTGAAKEAAMPEAKWESLRPQMRRDAEGLAMQRRTGTHRSVHLGGRYLHMSAAVRGADGQTRKQCFTSYDAMDKALRGQAPAKQEKEESDAPVEE